MKKFGFTLAEVLITLTIIGVVAMMTLPALMTNVNEQAAKTALKKICSMLTDIGQITQATEGFDYSTVTEAGFDESKSSLIAMLHPRLNIDETKSTIAALTGNNNCVEWNNDKQCIKFNTKATDASKTLLGNAGTTYTALFLRDGTALVFDPYQTSTANGMVAYFDINGTKKPNKLSYCDDDGQNISATDSLATKKPGLGELGANGDYTAMSACANATKRHVGDQFVLRLNGIYATPGDPISQYLFDR